MIVPVVLGFYCVVCLSVVLFNCWKVAWDALARRRFERLKIYYRLWFWRFGRDMAALPPHEREEEALTMARELQIHGRLTAFHAAMDEIGEDSPQIVGKCMPLLAEIVRGLLIWYGERSERKQAYYTYLVTHFQVMRYAPSERLTAFLLRQIGEAKSLYNLENALRAVYSAGDVALVLKALELLDGAEGVFIHEKLLVDGLLTFEPRDELIAALWPRMALYGAQMRELLLDYIRFASGAWREEMLALLRSTEELEVRIACLRYFGKYPDERVRPLLYQIGRECDDARWELYAVCMTVLSAYPEGETVEILKRGLRSRNWYVRYNAALSLRELKVDAALVRDVLEGDDRYAKEMLQYRLGLCEEEREAVTV